MGSFNSNVFISGTIFFDKEKIHLTFSSKGVYKMWQEEALKKSIKVFLALGFGLPLLPLGILFIDGAFGQANPGEEIAW